MKKIFLFGFTLSFGLVFSQQQTHTIKANESIENIAKTYRVSPTDILKKNPALKEGIKKDMVIVIPSGKVKYYSTQRPFGFVPHTVEAKETFFGLSQKYGITIDDLKRYNFELYSRELQEGERISIPIFGKTSSAVEKGIQGQRKYVVKPQETLWRIARNHQISQEELEKINPGLTSETLKEGQEIWVPIQTAASATKNGSTKNQKDDMVLYSVEKAEGFYSLERKFGLSESELIKLNPELKGGIKSDSQIWIPKENYDRYKYGTTPISDGSKTYVDSSRGIYGMSSPQNVKEISFVLPFRVSDVGADDKITSLRERLTGNNKVTSIATDFYSGALIALDSLQKMGYTFKVNVFDSEGSDKELKKIVSNENLLNSQLIIGPFQAKSFNTLSKYITDIALLAPLSNKNIDLNANVYQTLPTDELQQNKMIAFLSKKYANANLMILADSKNTSIREKLERSFPNVKVITDVTTRSIPNALDFNRENIAIIQSNDVGYVSNAVRVLHNALSLKKNNLSPKIILATLERGSVYESGSISNNQLSDLQFMYPTFNKYSDGGDSFSQRYLKTYGILPNRYVIRGFDITMDAILRLGVSGNFATANAKIGETSYIENKFVYLRNPYQGGGYENQGVYIVKYENMEVKEVAE